MLRNFLESLEKVIDELASDLITAYLQIQREGIKIDQQPRAESEIKPWAELLIQYRMKSDTDRMSPDSDLTQDHAWNQ
jgi:hypothetical protein